MESESSQTETVKYLISIKFTIAGIVEKSDVIGAIFGQTEGLLGDSLDLRDLQRTSRIGRIVVNIQYNKAQRKTTGSVVVPSSLDRVETAILAASLETVDRVGPCVAKIQLQKIEDVRSTKREQIISRATQILRSWDDEVSPESSNLVEEVVKQARVSAISKWGSDRLPAGPGVEESDTLIIVEGRADVLNLLKYGFRNVVAVQGTNIPDSIIPLTQRKRTIAFLDGDRGGELILKELLELAEVDYVARAPPQREVEELTGKEVLKSLRNRLPIEQVLKELEIEPPAERPESSWKREKKPERQEKSRDDRRDRDDRGRSRGRDDRRDRDDRQRDRPYDSHLIDEEVESEEESQSTQPEVEELPDNIQALVDQVGEFEGLLVNQDYEVVAKTTVKDLRSTLSGYEGDLSGVIFDGVVTQRLVDVAMEKNLSFVVGAQTHEVQPTDALKIYILPR